MAWEKRRSRLFCPSGNGNQGLSSQHVRFWEIGASADPPALVFHTDQGDVTVSKKRENSVTPKVFHASSRTVAHFKAHHDSAPQPQMPIDPWQNGPDPWRNYAMKTKPASSSTAPVPTVKPCLDEVEARILAKVDEQLKISKAGDEDVDMTAATSKLQTQVQELQSQNQKFEGMFTTVGQRMTQMEQTVTAQNSRIQELGTVIQQQMQQTDTLSHEVGQVSDNRF